jgi:hypothetical protein
MGRGLILLAASIILSFAFIVHADENPTLPSRKASVILPLLKAFHPKDGYSRIEQILGKEDVDVGNAIKDCFYRLDDGTSIRVRAQGDEVFSIMLENLRNLAQPVQVIDAKDKMWDH